MMEAMTELPRYVCHKTVWAVKIKEIKRKPSGSANVLHFIVPDHPLYAEFPVPMEYIEKHSPHAGGYFVVYKDGYKSFSPAEAFESGYKLVP